MAGDSGSLEAIDARGFGWTSTECLATWPEAPTLRSDDLADELACDCEPWGDDIGDSGNAVFFRLELAPPVSRDSAAADLERL